MVKPLGSKGYSLTEVMLVVLITGIIAGSAAPVLKGMTNFWRQTSARSEIQRDVRLSLDTINRFLRQAKSSTVQIDQLTGMPPYSRIGFTAVDGKRITIWQTGRDLKMSVNDGTTTKTAYLSHRVGFLAFSYPRTDDISIISVAVTMQAPTYLGGAKTLQLSIQKVRVMN